MSQTKIQKRPRHLCAALVLLLAGAAIAAGQHSPLDQVFDSLEGIHGFTAAAISPDSARAAWVEWGAGIYVANLRGSSAPQRIADGQNIVWSPDSKRLAFLSDTDKRGQLQLYCVDASGGAPKKLTDLKGFLAGPRWSPDGKTLAFLFTEDAPRAAGPLQPVTPEAGVVGEHIYEQRLTTVDLKSLRVRQLSPADLYVYEYDWSPDGRRFAATAAHGAGDNNWYIAQLYTIDAQTGKTEAILKPAMQIADPHWAPDGKSIAYIGGLMSDEGFTGGDIFAVTEGGGDTRDITPGMKASATGLHWAGSASRIVFTEFFDGNSGVAAVDLATGKIETLWSGPGVLSTNAWLPGISLARDGRTSAVIRHSFQNPPEVWAGPIGDWKQLTELNRDARPAWGQAKSLHWTSDGLRIQGWLLYPRDYNPQQRYPLVVFVHGGPSGMLSSHWPSTNDYGTMLAAAGYFVLFPNPRGSYGSGEAFTRANVKDFGYGDFRDILAGVDDALKTAPIDGRRVGITGWSYGGYMTMWAVTQTNRFRAAVAGAGLANWQSYYGENQIDQWMIPFFGASVYDDPAIYARSSPITFIKNVKTPTLILVGDRDAECPPPQSWEFWHALKTLGVETQFVIYPNEGHMIASPEHQRDIARRTAAWFDRYLR